LNYPRDALALCSCIVNSWALINHLNLIIPAQWKSKSARVDDGVGMAVRKRKQGKRNVPIAVA
jgi:hypothetical protein